LTARSLGYRVLCLDCYNSRNLEREYLLAALDAEVAGIVLLCPDDTKNLSLFQKMVKKIPAVQAIAPHPNIEADSVTVNEYAGATLAMEHLARLGCRQIGHISFNVNTLPVQERARAYREFMERTHLSIQASWVLELPGYLYHAEPARREPLLRRFLDHARRPSAVFAQADRLAVELIQVATELGLSVPKDLSVVGFDDVPAHALTGVPLTTVRQDFRHLGRLAVERLVARVQGKALGPSTAIRTQPQLIVRESTMGNLVTDVRWARVQNWLVEKFRGPLSARELAAVAALEEHYFSKQFARAFGERFTEYRNHLRLDYGRELLTSTDWAIDVVARDSGFQNPNQFYRLFKRKYGMTPNQYRAEHAGTS
jgi:DNA-binding LacI/PurR family transcriptional regulator